MTGGDDDDLAAEAALRERVEELVGRARTDDRVSLVEAFNAVGADALAAADAGRVPRTVVLGILRDLEDALLVRGVGWIDPALPELSPVESLADLARAPGPAPAAATGGRAEVPLTVLRSRAPLPPARGTLATGDGAHGVAWVDGVLVLDAHPDPEADEALAALGGSRCACLDVRAAWLAQRHEPSILTVGARSPSDHVELPAPALAAARDAVEVWRNRSRSMAADLRDAGEAAVAAGVVAAVAATETAVSQRLGFLALLSLPPALLARLQAEAAAALADRGGPRALLRLDLAVRARLRAARADAGAREGSDPPGAVSGPGWLVDVWARGIAAVDGRVAIGIEPDGDTLVVDLAGGGKARLAAGVDGWETGACPEP